MHYLGRLKLPMASGTSLLAMPPEVIERIAYLLWSAHHTPDFYTLYLKRIKGDYSPVYSRLSLRLACTQLRDTTDRVFGRLFFESMPVVFTGASLDHLDRVAS